MRLLRIHQVTREKLTPDCHVAFRKLGIDKVNAAGETRLMRAVVADNVKLITRLISEGADVTIKDNAGWAPIHESANVDVTEMLLKAEVSRIWQLEHLRCPK